MGWLLEGVCEKLQYVMMCFADMYFMNASFHTLGRLLVTRRKYSRSEKLLRT